MRNMIRGVALAVVGMLGTAAPSYGQTVRLHCANGSVADTTSVTITGNTARVARGSDTNTGRVERDEAFYRITFPNGGGDMVVNRSTGASRIYRNANTPIIFLRCSLGGPRM